MADFVGPLDGANRQDSPCRLSPTAQHHLASAVQVTGDSTLQRVPVLFKDWLAKNNSVKLMSAPDDHL